MGFTETVLGWADQFPFLADLLQDPFLLAMGITMLTAALVAACVPGVIIPLAFSSGVLLGGWEGMLVVVTGALLGSQLLFVMARYFLHDRVHSWLDGKLDRFDEHFAHRGIFYIIGLRVAGAPHFLVTGASALTPVRAGPFALATLLGFLPIIAFTAIAASAASATI